MAGVAITKISKKQLSELQKLEGELGVVLIAYERYDLKNADLPKKAISKIRSLEKSFGEKVFIIAYHK